MPELPDESPNRPLPSAGRVREVRRQAPPRTGWWWFALALTGLMAMVLVGTVVWSASMAVAASARKSTPTTAARPQRPNSPDGTQLGLGDPANVIPDPEKVTAFFTRFAAVVRDPKGRTDDLFDWSELTTAVPEDAIESPVAVEGTALPPNWHALSLLQNELNVWREWDWTKLEVRKVSRRPDGEAVEAVVWHHTLDGRLVKRRWTMTESADGLRALGWEDLRTGMTARDRVYARAASALSPSVRRQRQWQYDEVTQLHRLIDQRRWDDATKLLDRLRMVRFDGELQYAIDLAEGRLAFLNRVSDEGEWDQDLAVEILEELVGNHPERLAAYLYLAEAHLLGEEYDRVIEVCDSLMSVTDADPDTLALRGTAKLALLLSDDASADFLAALALDRHQPRAVNWQRQQADAAGKKAVADTLATAPLASELFESLAGWAIKDQDWEGVRALAEKYRSLRPNDSRWVSPLVEAMLGAGRVADAVSAFQAGIKVVSPGDRPQLVERFARSMIVVGQAEWVYAAVPQTDAHTAFKVLAEHYEFRRQRWVKQATSELTAERERNEKALLGLITVHRKTHPDDPYLALHDARLQIDRGQFKQAADVISPALGKVPRTGDLAKDTQSGYRSLLREYVFARYKAGESARAYREHQSNPEVFGQLVDLLTVDKDADGLTRATQRLKVGA